MKKIKYILFLISILRINGQGQDTELIIENINGVLVRFNDNCTNIIQNTDCKNEKGIILPSINLPSTSSTNGYTEGTFIIDREDKKLKVLENGQWKLLSFQPGNTTKNVAPTNSSETGKGIYITGNETSVDENINGVLILESTNKALVLPKINKPYEVVKDPYPGMMCYDIDSKSLMLFDGKYWNIWKKKNQ